MNVPELTNLKVNGDISVEPVAGKLPEDAFVYAILGPTGAGKSCFIQALAGDVQDLGISKDQLAGFTQHASAYRLINVWIHRDGRLKPIFLIDTPGFSDPRISDLGVVRAWGKVDEYPARSKILFFTPISQTRMPGTKRRTIETFKAAYDTSRSCAVAMTVVTTMWDKLYSERSHERAQSNYASLRDEIFKDFSDIGATIAQFTNTRTSALQILDMGPWVTGGDEAAAGVARHLYRDLYERIINSRQQKHIIESELAHSSAQTNLELKALLERNHAENEGDLTQFVEEWIGEFRTPPVGLEDGHYDLLKSLVGTYIPRNLSMRVFLLRCFLARWFRNAKRLRRSRWFNRKS